MSNRSIVSAVLETGAHLRPGDHRTHVEPESSAGRKGRSCQEWGEAAAHEGTAHAEPCWGQETDMSEEAFRRRASGLEGSSGRGEEEEVTLEEAGGRECRVSASAGAWDCLFTYLRTKGNWKSWKLALSNAIHRVPPACLALCGGRAC